MVGSGVVPTVRLTQIYRQAAESLIIPNAHKLLRGEAFNLKHDGFDFLTQQPRRILQRLELAFARRDGDFLLA